MEKAPCPLCHLDAAVDRYRVPQFTYTCCSNCKDFLISSVAEAEIATRPFFRADCVEAAQHANVQRLLAITVADPFGGVSHTMAKRMVPRQTMLPRFDTCRSPFVAGLWLD